MATLRFYHFGGVKSVWYGRDKVLGMHWKNTPKLKTLGLA